MRKDSAGRPHVTDILQAAGLVDPTWFTDDARDLGTAVHIACHYLDEGDLDWNSINPNVVLRVRQYQKFRDDMKPEILSIEEDVINEAFHYCGRLDRRLRINGREGVLDMKGPGRFPWQAIQCAMYAACFNQLLARWTLHLSDERYLLIEHKGRQDWEIAKAALTLAMWKEAYGNGNGNR